MCDSTATTTALVTFLALLGSLGGSLMAVFGIVGKLLEWGFGLKRVPKAVDDAFQNDMGYAEMKVTASDGDETASASFTALEAKLTRAHQAAREKLISEVTTKQLALEQQLREQLLQQQQRARQEQTQLQQQQSELRAQQQLARQEQTQLQQLQAELRAQLAQQNAKFDELVGMLDARSA